MHNKKEVVAVRITFFLFVSFECTKHAHVIMWFGSDWIDDGRNTLNLCESN